MALNFDLKASADPGVTIQVVCKFDECLDMDEDSYAKYIASGADESLLKLKEGKTLSDCTIFVLKKNLDWRGHEMLMKKQFEIDPITKQPVPNPAFVMTDIQTSLIGIKNPEDASFKIEFKTDRPGLASRNLVVGLHNAGILLDLFQARSGSSKGGKSALVEKKNS
jgi:hypothetical protein